MKEEKFILAHHIQTHSIALIYSGDEEFYFDGNILTGDGVGRYRLLRIEMDYDYHLMPEIQVVGLLVLPDGSEESEPTVFSGYSADLRKEFRDLLGRLVRKYDPRRRIKNIREVREAVDSVRAFLEALPNVSQGLHREDVASLHTGSGDFRLRKADLWTLVTTLEKVLEEDVRGGSSEC